MSTPQKALSVLSDSLRWTLMRELGRSDRTVGELVEIVAKPQNLVSYHLSALRDVGMVSARRSAADGRDVYYRSHVASLRDALVAAGRDVHPGLDLTEPPVDRLEVPPPRPRVLFLCTGNSARSQIAEALATHLSGGSVHARSAGSHPKNLHPGAVRVLANRGIDISGQRTTSMNRYVRTGFERVVTLCDIVREICPEFLGSPRLAHWSIPDPSLTRGSTRAVDLAFESVTDDIEGRVVLLLAELRQLHSRKDST